MSFVSHRSPGVVKGVSLCLLLLASVLLWSTHVSAQVATEPSSLWLENLDISKMVVGWGSPQAQKSIDGKPISMKGIRYAHGVGRREHLQVKAGFV